MTGHGFLLCSEFKSLWFRSDSLHWSLKRGPDSVQAFFLQKPPEFTTDSVLTRTEEHGLIKVRVTIQMCEVFIQNFKLFFIIKFVESLRTSDRPASDEDLTHTF